jgi:saccharopine dehydrogenase-like NADP-dependent oxidoreductase
MKNILILGAGLVSRPIVRYLLEKTDRKVVVASRTVSKAEALVGDHPRGGAIPLIVDDEAALDALVADAAVVVSLLPYEHHVRVAKMAIRHGIHMVTTSYLSPEMQALDGEAREAGVALLNELGVDPGIDHMSAMEIIHGVQGAGGRVVHFSSCCGGLPAPDSNTNPWGYKFSWSPRGVVLAGRNAAKYVADGEVVEIDGPDLFSNVWPYEVEDLGMFEIYPNRDSTQYVELYGLEGISNMFRGTIRYPGWCRTLKAVADLGLLDLDERVWREGTTYRDVLQSILPRADGSLVERVASTLDMDPDDDVISRLEWAGLLSDRPIDDLTASPLDVFAARLLTIMPYLPGERDMIILRHQFVAEYPGRPTEEIVSLLVDYGVPGGDSSMSRTVSLPAAIATRMLLEGTIRVTGVHIPVQPEIYVPVLAELGELGIAFREFRRSVLPDPFGE